MSALVNLQTPTNLGFASALFAGYFLVVYIAARAIIGGSTGPYTYTCGKKKGVKTDGLFAFGAERFEHEQEARAKSSPYSWFYHLAAPFIYPGDYFFGVMTFLIWAANSIAAIFLFMLNDATGTYTLYWITILSFHLIVPLLYLGWAGATFGSRSLLGGMIAMIICFAASATLFGVNGAYAAYTWDATTLPPNAWAAFGLYGLQVIWYIYLMSVAIMLWYNNEYSGEGYIRAATQTELATYQNHKKEIRDLEAITRSTLSQVGVQSY